MPATASDKPLNVMDKSLQATLVREVFCHLDAGTTDLATATYLNPVTNYTDQQRFVRERTALFERLPLLVGLSCQIANPGDYLTRDHAGVRQLIVRGEDGVVRAFMNVCRHRGARIAEGQGQGQQRFKCPYHGWTYDCAGRLLGIPDKRNFPDLDPAAQRLVQLPAVESHGMIWASASATENQTMPQEIDIDGYLAGLGPELASYGAAGYHHYKSKELSVAMNWKLVIDTFLESYHFGVLHQDSISPIFFSNLCLFAPFGSHLRVAYPRRTIESLRDLPEERWDFVEHAALVYVLFPNTVFVVQADHLEIWRIYPEGNCADRSTIFLDFFIPQPATCDNSRDHWDRNLALVLRVVEEEDFPTGEGIQFGFGSGAQSHVTYGRNEPALTYFEKKVTQMVDKLET